MNLLRSRGSLQAFALGIFLMILASGPEARELFPRQEPIKFEVGERMAAGDTIGGYPLWLNDGKWRLMFLDYAYSGGGSSHRVTIGRAYWVWVEGGKLVATMQVRANLDEDYKLIYWRDEPCKRDDFLWKRSIDSVMNENNCTSINHLVRFFAAPAGPFQQVYGHLTREKVDIPPTVISIGVNRSAHSGRFLEIILTINPESIGFQRDPMQSWGASEWHKYFALKDEKKSRYLAQLSSWATDLAVRVGERAFHKRQDAYAGLPVWPGQTASPSEPSAPKKMFD
jgi:hypothetical protein